MRKLLLVAAIATFSLAACKQAPEYPEIIISNPVAGGMYVGDPCIMLASDGHYYMTGSTANNRGAKMYRSDDLQNWEDLGLVYDIQKQKNPWTVTNFWAPELFEKDGKFYLFFSADWKNNPNHEKENFRLGVAVADSPEGPFMDMYEEPMFDTGWPVIDADVLFEDDGRCYIYFSRCCYKHPVESELSEWAREKGMFDEIEESWVYGAEMKPDFSGIIGEPVLLLSPPKSMSDSQSEWESRSVTSGEVNRRWTEGSFILKKDGIYYITYSANHVGGENYSIGYATGKSPLGPFTKADNNPIVTKNIDKGGIVSGVGHNTITWSRDGKQFYIVYHARTPQTGRGRVLFIDKMEIKDGKITVDGPTTATINAE